MTVSDRLVHIIGQAILGADFARLWPFAAAPEWPRSVPLFGRKRTSDAHCAPFRD